MRKKALLLAALLAVAAEKELPQYVPDFSLVRRTDVLDAEGKPFR